MPSILLAIIVIWNASTQALYAQSNFQEGLIITQQDDSLRGLIDNQEWVENPDIVKFKQDTTSEIQVFSPLDLKSFHVSGRWYRGTIVPVDQTTLKAKLLHPAVTPSTKQDTVFLSVLVKGPLTLYYYKDKRRHFYLERSSEIVELISREYKVRRNGDIFVHKGEAKEYLKQITRFVPLCRDLNVEDLQYRRGSLMEFTVQCNKRMSPSAPSYVAKTERPKFDSGIQLGISRPNFKVNFNDDSVPFHKTRSFTIGYTGRIILPGRRGRHMYFFSLRYNRIKSQNAENYSNVATNGMCFGTGSSLYCEESKIEESYEDMIVDVGYLNLASGYRYHFSAGSVRPYMELGLSLAKRIHYRANGHHTVKVYQFQGYKRPNDEDMELVDTYNGRDEFLKPYSFSVGALMGAGIKFGVFHLALRNDINFFASNSSLLRTLYLTAGFDLSD